MTAGMRRPQHAPSHEDHDITPRIHKLYKKETTLQRAPAVALTGDYVCVVTSGIICFNVMIVAQDCGHFFFSLFFITNSDNISALSVAMSLNFEFVLITF